MYLDHLVNAVTLPPYNAASRRHLFAPCISPPMLAVASDSDSSFPAVPCRAAVRGDTIVANKASQYLVC